MRRLILIAAASLTFPAIAQVTAPVTTGTGADANGTAATTENRTSGADADAGTSKPAKAKAKHKSRATESATSDRAPIDNNNYLPTTQNPY